MHELGGPNGSFAPQFRTVLEVAVRDVDYLGHMTAASYPAVYEEAMFRFVRERWPGPDPCYVDASMCVRYLHEVRMASSPMTVALCVVEVGRSSFRVQSTMSDAAGRLCSTAEARYVAWDINARKSRPLTDAERAGLEAP